MGLYSQAHLTELVEKTLAHSRKARQVRAPKLFFSVFLHGMPLHLNMLAKQ
jgi:membrane associated rhomboid family serine protease